MGGAIDWGWGLVIDLRAETLIRVSRLQFLWFPSGIIRGALAAMGLQTTVHAESSDLPGVVFQIKTVGAKM
jgi:hypothetical protein